MLQPPGVGVTTEDKTDPEENMGAFDGLSLEGKVAVITGAPLSHLQRRSLSVGLEENYCNILSLRILRVQCRYRGRHCSPDGATWSEAHDPWET